jgi:hypothetical protein
MAIKIKGILQIILGVTVFIGGIVLGCTWVGFCFGSVVIGFLLLVFAPKILFVPFTFGTIPGAAFLYIGLKNFRSKQIE